VCWVSILPVTFCRSWANSTFLFSVGDECIYWNGTGRQLVIPSNSVVD